jgi:hypothetical protein
MNAKTYKKLLDDRIKVIPPSVINTNKKDQYTIIPDDKTIQSQKDLFINPNMIILENRYQNSLTERNDFDKLFQNKKTELEIQKQRTQDLLNKLNLL